MILCPNCGSGDVLVQEVSSYFINTDEFFCHSHKTHDKDAPCKCLDCNWTGVRKDIDKETK